MYFFMALKPLRAAVARRLANSVLLGAPRCLVTVPEGAVPEVHAAQDLAHLQLGGFRTQSRGVVQLIRCDHLLESLVR